MTKLIFSFSLLFYAQALFAFKFMPMSQTLKLNQDLERVVFTIENDSESPIAVELKLRTRHMKIDGSEEQKELPEGSPLSLYPEQLIVPAAQKRSVRVSWSSENKPPNEQAYRVIAEQLPVNLEGDAKPAGIKMLLRYVAALYVNPGQQKPQVVLENYTLDKNDLKLKLNNKGGEHQLLNDLILIINNKEDTQRIKASEIQGLQGENILAKTTRLFTLPLKGSLSELKEGLELELEWDK